MLMKYLSTVKVGSEALFTGDKLILRGLTFHESHGLKPEESSLGQKLLVDVDAWMDTQAVGASHTLTESDYDSAIYRIVKEVVGVPRRDLLLGYVAEQIATAIMEKKDQISAVRV
ncbi:hypothetical protein L6164_007712 [Bauhinia variegata]|uniref:Uncharacterized protein n=1 Tax=Bauhinia variegata TaxID=167791 RepID=A0ACB9PEF5_BAUVA|nr:hypothetical protein L6164_007712 [Bauhinia variegata]